MNFEKDIKRHNKGHIKDTKNTLEYRTYRNFVYDEHHFSYLCKKTERLCAALYMLTDFFPNEEPIKWRVREKGIAAISDIRAGEFISLSDRGVVLRKVSAIFSDIVSLLEISFVAGLISSMNLSVIRREALLIQDLIDGRNEVKEPIENFSFSEDFFIDDEIETARVKAERENPLRGQDKAPIMFPAFQKERKADRFEKRAGRLGSFFEEMDSAEGIALEDGIGAKENFQNKRSAPNPHGLPAIDSASGFKIDRRQKIKALFSPGVDMTLKDVAKSFADCGEKTIQRELSHLVSEGFLQKRGERRWSTYSLL